MNFSEEYHSVDHMHNRQGLYTFLARVFVSELDKRYVTTLLESNAFADNTEKQAGGIFEKGKGLVQDALESWKNEDIDETIKTLRKDFAHLFLVKNEGVVNPYESIYLGRERLLMQEPYLQVRAFYEKSGAVRTDDSQEIEDHIAVECEFMAMLCGLSVEAWKENNKEKFYYWNACQEGFLREHLGRWVSPLCRDMLNRTTSLFYEGIAYMAEGFIDAELGEVRRTLEMYNHNMKVGQKDNAKVT